MLKKVKVIMVILVVILVSFVAFFGVFYEENGVWKNQIPDYQYGMDIKGARELIYALSNTEEEKYVYVDEAGNVKGEVWKDGSPVTQEEEQNPSEEAEEGQKTDATSEEVPYAKETRTMKVNEDEKLTKENFEQAKKIIQKRLKEQELNENHIRIDDVTGKLVIENGNEEEQIELIKQMVSNPGTLKIIDYQNGVVLMDNSDIKNASVVYSNQSSYATYLQIQFNKKGAEKLKEISNQYVEIKKEAEAEEVEEGSEENTEAADKTEETEKKYVSIVFDDTTMMTTYFGEEMGNGILQIAVGQARNSYEDFIEDYNRAKVIADMLNSGVLPVTYELETDNFVKAEDASQWQNAAKIFLSVVVILSFLLFIIKFKKNGALGAISNIGYIAFLSLILRVTNVEITVNSMITLEIILIMNLVFLKMLLNKLQTEKIGQAYREVSKKFYFASVPVIVMALVFTFAKSYAISSVGMLVFWGIIIHVLYNLIVTRIVFGRED